MKNLFKHIATLCALLFSIFGIAQNENALLWKITGNGLQNPSYIFGTIHMVCENDYFLNENVENALRDSENLYTEINFGNTEEMILMQKSVQTSVALKDRISEQKYTVFKNLLNEKLNLDIESLNNFSDAGIASMITMKSFACDDLKMYELELLKQAMTSQKTLGGLETVAEQMLIMEEHLNIDACIKMLEEMGSANDSNKEMVQLYKEQNIDKLLDLLNKSSYMTPKAYHEFVVKRNSNWVEKIPEIIKNKPTFFAVGAAHLGSKDGVLELLRAKGFLVEAVN